MSGVNVELLEQVMQHIEDHPELHNQANWGSNPECGTAMCFAGWAAHLSGAESVTAYGTRIYTTDGGRTLLTTSEAAETALGITEHDADVLFGAINTRPMLRLMVKDLVNGESLRRPSAYRTDAS